MLEAGVSTCDKCVPGSVDDFGGAGRLVRVVCTDYRSIPDPPNLLLPTPLAPSTADAPPIPRLRYDNNQHEHDDHKDPAHLFPSVIRQAE